ncbi:hypothetical protein BDV97DRAFT_228111 [Delphinella strobiligena]|nr:hypothetical protein BDV97DRAFT_228111 [Delphinella strobiligena]
MLTYAYLMTLPWLCAPFPHCCSLLRAAEPQLCLNCCPCCTTRQAPIFIATWRGLETTIASSRSTWSRSNTYCNPDRQPAALRAAGRTWRESLAFVNHLRYAPSNDMSITYLATCISDRLDSLLYINSYHTICNL